MAGWSSEKRERVEEAFRMFLTHAPIDSKDHGRIFLGRNLYWGQDHAITRIFDGLEEDIHDFYFLKARQLGISTDVRALTVFLLGIFKGMRGALVFDTAPNREEARQELIGLIRNLPPFLNFPKVRGTGEGNREGLTLVNDSRILFKSAGVKKSKSSGTLGRSVGLSFATLSELCSYDNEEGLQSFRESLSDINPDRLYVFESTARGYNNWYTMWQEAKKDSHHKMCIFLGWWAKQSQMIPRSDPDFQRYGMQEPTEKEKERIEQVRKLYGFQVSQEQLAWYRRKMDPGAALDDDADPEEAEEVDYEGSSVQVQEQPWTEDEAFQNTGAQFISVEKLNIQSNKYVKRNDFDCYMFTCGNEFSHMRINPAPNPKSTDLRVWEDPDPEGVYVFGVDPAFGENDQNDRGAIEIGRCYADGIDQVAEFASSWITAQQLAWALAALMGWYGGGDTAECRYILELNGPGTAVWNELKQLRFQLENKYWPPTTDSEGLPQVFKNVRSFIYRRPDSMGAGHNYHWKTSGGLKVMIMNHLKDYVGSETYHVRSAELIEELKSLAQEGDTIEASGTKKDDRALAAALKLYYWQTSIRPGLIQRRLTRASVEARKSESIMDMVSLFNRRKLDDFFGEKRRAREQQEIVQLKAATRMRWRHR